MPTVAHEGNGRTGHGQEDGAGLCAQDALGLWADGGRQAGPSEDGQPPTHGGALAGNTDDFHLAPRLLARSRIDWRPRWPATGSSSSKPAPSSLTSNSSAPGTASRRTVTLRAQACFTTLCNASWTMRKAASLTGSGASGSAGGCHRMFSPCLTAVASTRLPMAATRPSFSRNSGRSSKMRERISARAASASDSTYSMGSRAARGSRRSRVRAVLAPRAMPYRAWDTESCSSRASRCRSSSTATRWAWS